MKKTHDDLIHNKLQGCYERKYTLLKQSKICAKTKMSLLPKGTSWSSWPQGTTRMLPCNCFDLVCIMYL